MDEMKITSKFTTNLISKIINKLVQKKVGCNANIQLNEVRANVNDGKTHLHLDIDAEISQEELTKILKNIDLF